MKLLSPSTEAAAKYLGVSLPEAEAILRQRRRTEEPRLSGSRKRHVFMPQGGR